VWLELGRLDLDAGDNAAARAHLSQAMRTAPGSAAARAAQALLARVQD
jgi:Tfp pilus assembly protein PilF